MSKPSDFELAIASEEVYYLHTYDTGSSEVFIEDHDDYILISCRGTEVITTEPLDILRDIWFIPWYDKILGMNHRGFTKGVNRILDLIIKNLPDDKKPIYLTGHSKGAAEATLLAAALKAHAYNVHSLVTFGCPRVAFWGSRVKKLLKGVKQRRYVLGNDPVPKIPPVLTGYKHVSGSIKLKPSTGKMLKDHSMTNYVERIQQMTMKKPKGKKMKGASNQPAARRNKNGGMTKSKMKKTKHNPY